MIQPRLTRAGRGCGAAAAGAHRPHSPCSAATQASKRSASRPARRASGQPQLADDSATAACRRSRRRIAVGNLHDLAGVPSTTMECRMWLIRRRDRRRGGRCDCARTCTPGCAGGCCGGGGVGACGGTWAAKRAKMAWQLRNCGGRRTVRGLAIGNRHGERRALTPSFRRLVAAGSNAPRPTSPGQRPRVHRVVAEYPRSTLTRIRVLVLRSVFALWRESSEGWRLCR